MVMLVHLITEENRIHEVGKTSVREERVVCLLIDVVDHDVDLRLGDAVEKLEGITWLHRKVSRSLVLFCSTAIKSYQDGPAAEPEDKPTKHQLW